MSYKDRPDELLLVTAHGGMDEKTERPFSDKKRPILLAQGSVQSDRKVGLELRGKEVKMGKKIGQGGRQ